MTPLLTMSLSMPSVVSLVPTTQVGAASADHTPAFAPPAVEPAQLLATLRQQGFAVLGAEGVSRWLGQDTVSGLESLVPCWDRLPADAHLKDGGRYRSRRHGSCVVSATGVQAVAHRAHWQPVAYNALHGGMQRWFEPLEPAMASHPAWSALHLALGKVASGLRGVQDWYAESHPFRIDTTDGIGRPTPEGAHRDGVDLVAVFLVARHGIKGGESRVFEADGPAGQRFTLTEPWSVLLLDDQRVIHESTPIQPTHPDVLGWRDTLVVTLRAGGFQDEF